MPGHFNFSKIILTKIIGFPLFKSKLNAFPWRTLVQTYPQPRIISTDAKKIFLQTFKTIIRNDPVMFFCEIQITVIFFWRPQT